MYRASHVKAEKNLKTRVSMILSERIYLRRFLDTDWRDLYEYLSLESVVRFEPYDPFTEKDCIEAARERQQQMSFWAVCLRSSEKMIGNLYFEPCQPEDYGNWKLGYVFNPVFGKKGYALESCRALLNEGFTSFRVRRVVAYCDPENRPSWRLLERLGMRREGHLRQNVFFKKDSDGNPVWKDTYEYAILADEWNTLSKAPSTSFLPPII
ncbi:MAG: GNAT family N-acetyltransferase [Thermotogae bacterium]|nr:GNAT family N-acetyltransferase [Thermotogota bacterium]